MPIDQLFNGSLAWGAFLSLGAAILATLMAVKVYRKPGRDRATLFLATGVALGIGSQSIFMAWLAVLLFLHRHSDHQAVGWWLEYLPAVALIPFASGVAALIHIRTATYQDRGELCTLIWFALALAVTGAVALF